ncbi:MAG TPA: carboxymuconolactone decarboxylase family protein [Microbacteriaceae bacterium]|nr:carboxymuconolactone decarboxylase family protein [Microbacteriaceae bacterium]
MSVRRPYIDKTNPEIYKAMVNASEESKKASREAGLSLALIELVNTRVSQINGCVTCLSIHAAYARNEGVSQLKLDVLPAWRDATIYSEEERTALLLAESLTTINHSEDRDMTIKFAKEFFTEEQVVAIEWAVILIGAFNRISIASGHPAIRK